MDGLALALEHFLYLTRPPTTQAPWPLLSFSPSFFFVIFLKMEQINLCPDAFLC